MGRLRVDRLEVTIHRRSSPIFPIPVALVPGTNFAVVEDLRRVPADQSFFRNRSIRPPDSIVHLYIVQW